MKYKYIIYTLLLIISCKSTKKISKDNTLDVKKMELDKTIKSSSSFSISHSLDEIVLNIYDPKEKTTITDNKGNTQTFTNIKSITAKKEKKDLKQDSITVKNDTTSILIDKSEIKEEEQEIQQSNDWKYILYSIFGIALIVFFIKLLNKFSILD